MSVRREEEDAYEFEKIDGYEIVETNSFEKMSLHMALTTLTSSQVT